MSETKTLIGNWKLNHDRKTAMAFFNQVFERLPKATSLELSIAPVAPMLDFVGGILKGQNQISLCAQNVFYADLGAFTGEWSAAHLVELSVKYCIVGHSERRKLFFENDVDVKKKTIACLSCGIIPVICVGESLQERETGQTNEIIKRQVKAVISELVLDDARDLCFAYEPLWAIGTGKNATPEQAQIVHELIRGLIKESLGEKTSVRILYGGSVTPENIKEIVSMPDVNGVLVGGASLQASSFLSMVETLRAF